MVEVDKIYQLFEENQPLYGEDNVGCLADISVRYNIKPSLFKGLKIDFCLKSFQRRVRSILKGNGDGLEVFIFYFLKKKIFLGKPAFVEQK
jgi:hypothetical protein